MQRSQTGDRTIKMKYFAMRSDDPIIPRRAGYYIGYLLVRNLANNYTLDELIRLKDTEFVPKFQEELEKMKSAGKPVLDG